MLKNFHFFGHFDQNMTVFGHFRIILAVLKTSFSKLLRNQNVQAHYHFLVSLQIRSASPSHMHGGSKGKNLGLI